MSSIVFAFNSAANMTGIILCILGIIYVLTGAKIDKRLDRFFLSEAGCLILFSLVTMFRQILSGHQGATLHVLLMISCFLEYICSSMIAYIMSVYLLISAGLERTWLMRFYSGLIAAHILAVLISVFTGLFFSIDEMNNYSRSTLYPLCYVAVIIMMISNIIIIIRHKDELSRKERQAFLIYIIPPVVSILLQIIIPGLNFGVVACFIAIFYLYMVVVAVRTREYYHQFEENTRLKIDIMVTQIQPHFLFNTLSTIQALCSRDPDMASELIGKFGVYLRHNINSLNMSGTIPIEKEIDHTLLYTDIEKVRFPNICVTYDIQDKDFRVPPISVQPMVENAIRHGVRICELGQVNVLTRKKLNCHEIVIQDNGKGFDTDMIGKMEDAHVGIKNVKARIEQMCSGEVEIESIQGEGTTVTIRIPDSQKEGLAVR